MASASLVEELNCSICLDIYTDPVMLKCGHIFCQDCIGGVLGVQERSGVYSCPECRLEFSERPSLEKNRKLCSIVERFMSSMAPEDRLTQAVTQKCAIHKEILGYYCLDDVLCVCESCCFSGRHGRHQVVLLQEAFEIKRAEVKRALQNLTIDRTETEERAQYLQEYLKKAKEKASSDKERVTGVLRDIRRQLEDLEEKVLGEVSSWEEQVVRSISDVIQQLDLKISTCSQRIHDYEMIFKVSDPLEFLQEERVTSFREDATTTDINPYPTKGLQEVWTSRTLLTGLENIMTETKEILWEKPGEEVGTTNQSTILPLTSQNADNKGKHGVGPPEDVFNATAATPVPKEPYLIYGNPYLMSTMEEEGFLSKIPDVLLPDWLGWLKK